jgi:hypothetical protein
MDGWTAQQVLALAPDAASASAGQSLASDKKWSGLGRSARAAWGLCQGSGKDPYQARIDFAGPAFKCSCPSRKFPCKHGLGLALLLVKSAGAFKAEAEPGWVSEWLAGRAEREAKKVKKAQSAPASPEDAEAAAARAAQRAAQRESRVEDGVAGCRVWLEDLARRGLAAARAEPGSSFERTAARMVDAQAPGLAALVRRVPELLASGAGWDVRTLDHLGRLHLLLRAGERLKDLPPDLAGEVRTALGWTRAKEDVLAGEGVADCWMALGQSVEEVDRLRSRRTWLVGRRTRRRALLLDFAAGAAPLPAVAPAGTEFEGEVAFYSGGAPLRALVKSAEAAAPIRADAGEAAHAFIEDALREYAGALGANPWLARWPLLLRGVRVAPDGDAPRDGAKPAGGWVLADARDDALPLRPSFQASPQLWRLISASGGAPLTVLAEWDGEHALPLGALRGAEYVELAAGWAQDRAA